MRKRYARNCLAVDKCFNFSALQLRDVIRNFPRLLSRTWS